MIRLWSRLSNRERALAGVTLALAALILGLGMAKKALSYLDELDAEIARLEQDLFDYQQRLLRKDAVDKAFGEIAAEHSSRWSAEEIRDGLHQEIYRLALVNMEAAQGGYRAPKASERLVSISQLPEGRLSARGQGYREYKLGFRADARNIRDLAVFLARIEESPQALRIDDLEIKRQPEAPPVNATIEIARVVVDGVPGADGAPASNGEDEAEPVRAAIRNGGFEAPGLETGSAPDWVIENIDAAPDHGHATEGFQCIRLVAAGSDAVVYQEHEAGGNQRYRLSLDLTVEGAATISASLGGARREYVPLPGAQTVENSPPTRYVFEFTIPGETGETVSMRAPMITLAVDTVAYLDNVTLEYVEAGDAPK